MFRNAIAVIALVSTIGIGQSSVHAQGMLISSDPDHIHRLPRIISRPVPGQPGFLYDIAKLEIDASIRGQVAEVQVGQTFKNRTNRVLQVKFVFPLPYDGAIDQMTFMVDGEELEGRLLEADKAHEIYQSYVRRSQDPALVQWIGTGMFQTQVFPVPAGAERTVSLRYTQLCRRSGSLNDWLLPLSPTKFTCSPIAEVAIRGRIRSETKLGNVYSPTHDIEIDRSGEKVVKFEYEAKGKVPDSDFRMMWDTGDSPVQVSVVAHRPKKNEDGYFMLMIQPQLPEPQGDQKKIGKNVILVMDKSGSMKGEKIDQARKAADYVVGKLKGRDRFTLINYDSVVENFRSELTSADKETRTDAIEYIDSMLAGGSTNIDEALKQALAMAQQADGPAYVVFMTDGRPTVGERNAMKIADNAKRQLGDATRLFSLGVGHDVNSRLLDKLASICLGQTMYVRPGQPLDQVVSRLYDRIGAPALTDAKLKLTIDGKEGRTRQLYPSEMYDLFSGDQLVIVGRYRKAGKLQINLSGDYLGERQKFVFDNELPKTTGSGKNIFVERLWATRRIGQIIDDIDLHGENKEMVDELITLSKRHGILTPYTAYLAEEKTDLNDMQAGRRVTQSNLRALQQESGRLAFSQRAFKGGLKSANRANDALGDMEMNMGMDMSAMAPGYAAGPSNSRGASAQSLGRQRQLAVPNVAGNSFGMQPIPTSGTNATGQASKPAQVLNRKSVSEVVRRIGSKTFYLRAERLVDSEATKEQIAAAKTIAQFSDAYFDLLKNLDEEQKKYLAQEKEVLVLVGDQAYVIALAK
ncbi:VIT domain-containing protein [Planctomycetes bacterium K23_9]|uniref:von Willebrand factor type A domain protein n=1 Tax=Stieleria marina TaxID=1930275 RepID=A0A517P2R7_9BACT|nr:von Willebrand factor type A domain protein [Planctomycetes bacterium K23_9]